MANALRIGIIGCDTSHVTAFTKLLHDESDPHHVSGGRVVAAYPSFSEDVPSSKDRVGGFTDELKTKWGVTICDSVEQVVTSPLPPHSPTPGRWFACSTRPTFPASAVRRCGSI